MGKVVCDVPEEFWSDAKTGCIMDINGVQLQDWLGYYGVVCKVENICEEYEMFSSALERFIELMCWWER